MPLDAAITAQIEEAFILYDEDNDGKIDGKTFQEACRALGPVCGFPTKAALQDYADQLGDAIDSAKFVKTMSDRALEYQSMVKVDDFFFWGTGNPFAVLDKDGTGSISGAELKQVMMTLADKMNEGEYQKMWELTGATDPGDGPCDYKDLYAKLQACFQ
jgi:Ca2+-binding EF-hand superfamily protein